MPTFYSDRRNFLRILIGGSAGLSVNFRAFGQAAVDPIKATKLTDRIMLVSGDVGNVGLVLADDVLMMIDGCDGNRSAVLEK